VPHRIPAWDRKEGNSSASSAPQFESKFDFSTIRAEMRKISLSGDFL
jgi:hypothetical protein